MGSQIIFKSISMGPYKPLPIAHWKALGESCLLSQKLYGPPEGQKKKKKTSSTIASKGPSLIHRCIDSVKSIV